MSGRNILGVIVTSGVIAGIGYMMLPRKRQGFSLKSARMLMKRWKINRWGRLLYKTAARRLAS